MKIVRIHIAKSPCHPPYGISVEMEDGRELWDCDCASDSEEVSLKLAAEKYPDLPVTMWKHPEHYSQR